MTPLVINTALEHLNTTFFEFRMYKWLRDTYPRPKAWLSDKYAKVTGQVCCIDENYTSYWDFNQNITSIASYQPMSAVNGSVMPELYLVYNRTYTEQRLNESLHKIFKWLPDYSFCDPD